jgi:hypothetical protein
MKVIQSDGVLQMGELVNSEKALVVILGIFLSVAIAFVFGAIVQYISRLVFSFNYDKRAKFAVGIFGGLATTAIVYFMLIKGMKGNTLMSGEVKDFIYGNVSAIVWGCFVFFSILMQILHFCRVNVFRIIVLLGTFALAMAFAGNDLVNFIGIPLTALDSYLDLLGNGAGATPDTFLMTSLTESARTPWYFLLISGVIMVVALFTSKKAQSVVKTAVDLSSQTAGNEGFGTSPVARVLVRSCNNIANGVTRVIPNNVKDWIDSRFANPELAVKDKAAFDMVRAAVNVVMSGLLIAVGTSYKLPLSTTYVAFMVAMGSSLADRAWGRESAVYRITGVLSVIGGWFITAGAAFTITFVAAIIIKVGGVAAMLVTIWIAIYMLFRNHLLYKKRQKKAAVSEEIGATMAKLKETADKNEALLLFRQHTREELCKVLEFSDKAFKDCVNGFINENLKELKKISANVMEEKRYIKQMRRMGTIGVTRLEESIAVDKGLYYNQGNDFAGEIVFSIRRMNDACLEHVDNHFNPLDDIQREELRKASDKVDLFLRKVVDSIRENDYHRTDDILQYSLVLFSQLTLLKKGELKRIQGQFGSTKLSMLYLSMLQETQNVVQFAASLLKVSRKFQTE